MHLLRRVECHLRCSGTHAARFGRDAARDPRLVFDLRRGREVGARLTAQILDFIDQCEGKGDQHVRSGE